MVEISYELREMIPDCIDCVTLATEDPLILANEEEIRRRYSVRMLSFRDIVG